MAFTISWDNKLILHQLKMNATAIVLAHEIFIILFGWFQIFSLIRCQTLLPSSYSETNFCDQKTRITYLTPCDAGCSAYSRSRGVYIECRCSESNFLAEGRVERNQNSWFYALKSRFPIGWPWLRTMCFDSTRDSMRCCCIFGLFYDIIYFHLWSYTTHTGT